MIIIARLHSHKGLQDLWDEILGQHEAIAERLGEDVKLLYLTRRSRHNDVSLFMHVNDIESMGRFISTVIAPIDAVDGVGIINLISPRFFPIPKGTQPDLPRFSVTVKTLPKYSHSTYETMCETATSPDFVMTYVAKTFHEFDESIIMSMLARDKRRVQQFTKSQIETIPGVLGTSIVAIEDTHRLISLEEWHKYANLFPDHPGE